MNKKINLFESQLLEADGISGLDEVFPGFDSFIDVINADLGIFNDTSDLQFVHTVGDWDNLWLVVPDQTFNDDFTLDLLEQGE